MAWCKENVPMVGLFQHFLRDQPHPVETLRSIYRQQSLKHGPNQPLLSTQCGVPLCSCPHIRNRSQVLGYAAASQCSHVPLWFQLSSYSGTQESHLPFNLLCCVRASCTFSKCSVSKQCDVSSHAFFQGGERGHMA